MCVNYFFLVKYLFLVNYLKENCKHHDRSALNTFRIQLLRIRTFSHLTTPPLFYLKEFLYHLIFIPYPNFPTCSKHIFIAVFCPNSGPNQDEQITFGFCLLHLLKSRILSLLFPWQGFLFSFFLLVILFLFFHSLFILFFPLKLILKDFYQLSSTMGQILHFSDYFLTIRFTPNIFVKITTIQITLYSYSWYLLHTPARLSYWRC